MKIEINLEKKHLYTLLTITLLSLGLLYVAAAPGGPAPNPGHIGSQLAPGSVDTAQIADNAVTADELASDALSLAKVSGGLLTVLANDLQVAGKIQATGDVCTDLSGGVCLSSVTGGSDTDWVESGGNVYRQTGNVGVGTTSPTEKLHVVGTARMTSLSSCTAVETNAQGVLQCGVDDVGVGGADTDWIEAGGNVYRSLGNVGVGTTSPTEKLHVVGGARITGLNNCDKVQSNIQGVLSCGTDQVGTPGIGGSGALNKVPKFTGSTTLGSSIITDTGTNVGIGTTTPTQKLEVVGTISASTLTGQWLDYAGGNTGTVDLGNLRIVFGSVAVIPSSWVNSGDHSYSGPHTITLANSFANSNYQIVASIGDGSIAGRGSWLCYTGTTTESTATAYICAPDPLEQYTGAIALRYVAMGPKP